MIFSNYSFQSPLYISKYIKHACFHILSLTIPLSSFFMNCILLRVSNKSGSQGLIFSCVWDFLIVDLCSWQPLCGNYLKSEVEVWSSKEGVSFLQPSVGTPIDWRPPQAKRSPECGESITHGKNGLKHRGTGCFWFAILTVQAREPYLFWWLHSHLWL